MIRQLKLVMKVIFAGLGWVLFFLVFGIWMLGSREGPPFAKEKTASLEKAVDGGALAETEEKLAEEKRKQAETETLHEQGREREILRGELAEAELEMRLFLEELESVRQTIDEAIVMVREQKENYEFALDRYEKLMPLVETGALEPLAASQIQSAYISARASYAQAKFLLSQSMRDFGTEEGRLLRHQKLKKRIDAATKALQMTEKK